MAVESTSNSHAGSAIQPCRVKKRFDLLTSQAVHAGVLPLTISLLHSSCR